MDQGGESFQVDALSGCFDDEDGEYRYSSADNGCGNALDTDTGRSGFAYASPDDRRSLYPPQQQLPSSVAFHNNEDCVSSLMYRHDESLDLTPLFYPHQESSLFRRCNSSFGPSSAQSSIIGSNAAVAPKSSPHYEVASNAAVASSPSRYASADNTPLGKSEVQAALEKLPSPRRDQQAPSSSTEQDDINRARKESQDSYAVRQRQQVLNDIHFRRALGAARMTSVANSEQYDDVDEEEEARTSLEIATELSLRCEQERRTSRSQYEASITHALVASERENAQEIEDDHIVQNAMRYSLSDEEQRQKLQAQKFEAELGSVLEASQEYEKMRQHAIEELKRSEEEIIQAILTKSQIEEENLKKAEEEFLNKVLQAEAEEVDVGAKLDELVQEVLKKSVNESSINEDELLDEVLKKSVDEDKVKDEDLLEEIKWLSLAKDFKKIIEEEHLKTAIEWSIYYSKVEEEDCKQSSQEGGRATDSTYDSTVDEE